MSSSAKYCPKCRKIYPPSTELANCPQDGIWLQDLASLVNTKLAGTYYLDQELLTDSFGTLYAGRQEEFNRRIIAKVLAPELAEKTRHIEKFRRESHMLTRLDHQGLVKVYDCGISPRPYVVSEYPNGFLLSNILKDKGKLGEMEVYTLFRKLLEVLSYGHPLGLIHQDIKPANVMVNSLEPGNAEVKLIDFGFAMLIDQDLIFEKTGEAFGTPEYMSPEQFNHEGKPGPKSDIYSLGCMMYECLAGRNAFKAKGYIEYSAVHRHVGPVFSESDKLTRMGRELGALILQCMAKSPNERPSADAALAQLRKISLAPDDPDANTNVIEKIVEFAMTKPKLVGIAAVGILLVSFAVGIVLFSPKQTAEKPKTIATDDGKNELITALSSVVGSGSVKASRLGLKSIGGTGDAIIYSTKAAPAIVLNFYAEGSKSRALENACNTWAQQGTIVASCEVEKNIATVQLASLAKKLTRQVSKLDEFSKGKSSKFAIVASNLELDKSISACRMILGTADSDNIPPLQAMILIDPKVEAKPVEQPSTKPAKAKPASAVPDLKLKIPVFYVVDAESTGQSRSDTMGGVEKAFLDAVPKSIFYNSTKISLKGTDEDQKVLSALMTGFLDVQLLEDTAKDSLLYSSKAEEAVKPIGEYTVRD